MTGPLFTFDDGPSSYTAAILDLLAEHNVKATFFVTGQHAANPAYLETLQRTVLDGHTVGNHGWSHTRLTDLTDDQVFDELASTQDIVVALTGVEPVVFRAPYFGTDERVDDIAAGLGLTHFGASLVPDDWCATDPEALARVILSEFRPDSVVSLHDGVPPDGGSSSCTQTREVTVEALRIVLAGMA